MKPPGASLFLTALLFAASAPAIQSAATDASEMKFERQGTTCAAQRSILLKYAAPSPSRPDSREVTIWKLPGKEAFFFVSGMAIDADGAPNAYGPGDAGLDDLINAGSPAHWDGIVADPNGAPWIQGEADPFPGYYVSCTSLVDLAKKSTDPTRYVDASKIPYIVLPRDVADRAGAQLGDFAAVMNLRNGRSSYAIYADIGTLGEGSIALADRLGIPSDPREGGASEGILYLVFPGSGNLQPRPLEEIQSESESLLGQWGGLDKLASCVEED